MSCKPKVLAVDDERVNLDIMTIYIEALGYEVITAEDGFAALRELETRPDIDVIVLDRMMPKMDGMAVLKKVRADPRFRNIPVIMQSAAAASGQVEEGIDAGVYCYLTKPYDDVAFMGVLESAVRDSNTVSKRRAAIGAIPRDQFFSG
jgi:CheY-like chemotaxis protein